MDDLLEPTLDFDSLEEMLNVRREGGGGGRGGRSASGCSSSISSNGAGTSSSVRRCESSPSTSYFLPTKENALNQYGRKMLFCAAGSNKCVLRRQKHRPCPYERKPLNSLLNPMGRMIGLGRGSGRMRSSESYSEGRNIRTREHTFPLLFDEDSHHQDFSFPGRLNLSKTEKFPFPILSRSKSLEDLRDSPSKQRTKQVRFQLTHFDDNSNGTASSNGSNSVDSPPLSVSPRTSFLNALKGEASIKNEIDSMSKLIEKLDVA